MGQTAEHHPWYAKAGRGDAHRTNAIIVARNLRSARACRIVSPRTEPSVFAPTPRQEKRKSVQIGGLFLASSSGQVRVDDRSVLAKGLTAGSRIQGGVHATTARR